MALFGIKIKPLKIIGKVVQVAAPVALAVIDPAAGIVGAIAGGGGKGFKVLGKEAEKLGLGRPHKVASPVAALGLPGGIGAIPGIEFPQLTAFLESNGMTGIEAWVAIGLWMWFTHQAGNLIENAGNPEK